MLARTIGAHRGASVKQIPKPRKERPDVRNGVEFEAEFSTSNKPCVRCTTKTDD